MHFIRREDIRGNIKFPSVLACVKIFHVSCATEMVVSQWCCCEGEGHVNESWFENYWKVKESSMKHLLCP
jgi:hypothetical protein